MLSSSRQCCSGADALRSPARTPNIVKEFIVSMLAIPVVIVSKIPLGSFRCWPCLCEYHTHREIQPHRLRDVNNDRLRTSTQKQNHVACADSASCWITKHERDLIEQILQCAFRRKRFVCQSEPKSPQKSASNGNWQRERSAKCQPS